MQNTDSEMNAEHACETPVPSHVTSVNMFNSNQGNLIVSIAQISLPLTLMPKPNWVLTTEMVGCLQSETCPTTSLMSNRGDKTWYV